MDRFIATVVLVIVLFLGTIFGLVAWMAHTECVNKAEVMETNYRWKVLGGCFLETNGRFVHEDIYRVNDNS